MPGRGSKEARRKSNFYIYLSIEGFGEIGGEKNYWNPSSNRGQEKTKIHTLLPAENAVKCSSMLFRKQVLSTFWVTVCINYLKEVTITHIGQTTLKDTQSAAENRIDETSLPCLIFETLSRLQLSAPNILN